MRRAPDAGQGSGAFYMAQDVIPWDGRWGGEGGKVATTAKKISFLTCLRVSTGVCPSKPPQTLKFARFKVWGGPFLDKQGEFE
jgi:hypothetical protein